MTVTLILFANACLNVPEQFRQIRSCFIKYKILDGRYIVRKLADIEAMKVLPRLGSTYAWNQ